jgi:hypothetical protein
MKNRMLKTIFIGFASATVALFKNYDDWNENAEVFTYVQ